MEIPLQVTSLPDPPILTRDLNPLIQIPVSRQPPQATLPATDVVGPDKPTTTVDSLETRETSHAASGISHSFPRSDPILIPATSSTVASAVLSGLADVSNGFQRTTSTAALSYPQEKDKDYRTAMPCATTYISEISSLSYSIPQSVPSGDATLERDEEATEAPPIVVSLSQSSPMLMPAPRSNVISEVSSFIESPLIQPDSTSHALVSSTASATARSRIALQVTSDLDSHITSSIRVVSRHDETRGMEVPIPMEVFPHRSAAPAPVIDPVALPPEMARMGGTGHSVDLLICGRYL